MPVLRVTVDRAPSEALLRDLAAAVADALALRPDDVVVRVLTGPSTTGAGDPARWAEVVVQGRDRGPDADARVAAAIRRTWPDDRLSVAAVRDLR